MSMPHSKLPKNPHKPGQILWQNHQLVVSWKPAGYLSVPSQLGKQDPRPVWGKELEERLTQRLYPVHRLDLAVEGIILFTKTPQAQRLLQKAFETKQVTKWYQAFSFGGSWAKPFEVTWKSKILSGKKRAYERDWGEPSLTVAKLVKVWSYADLKQSGLEPYWHAPEDLAQEKTDRFKSSVGETTYDSTPSPQIPVHFYEWKLSPVTGKRHQLRFELYKHQSPILGDELYGSPFSLPGGRIALRAFELSMDTKFAQELKSPARFTIPSWSQPKSCAET
ncbi:MAG: pseudouridine synthase [Bdellovibrionaceae bacterium]|nr:pseudouridine synthase [Pseudobdellovibrionaceae bacterium]